jgi:hypothetical protein
MDVMHTVKVNRPAYPGEDGVWVIHDQLNSRRISVDDKDIPKSTKDDIGAQRAAFFHAKWTGTTWEILNKVKWRYW